jgi:AcrR family transcriptional regulator
VIARDWMTRSDRLVEEALGVFARLGYRVPVRRLASELGVTTGSLYHHFGSKDEMFLAVLRASVAADSAEFPALPPEVGPRDRVKLLIHAVKERETLLMRRLLVLHEYLRQLDGERPVELVAEMDQYASRLAQFFGSDDRTVGQFVLSLVNGALFRRYLDGGHTRWEDLERLLESSIESLLGR